MATIQYTSYKFNKPKIISADIYVSIKNSLKRDHNYNPFKFSIIEGYYKEFNIGVKFILIGVPLAGLLASTGISVFEFIGAIYGFIAFSAIFFGGMQSSFSFIGFCLDKKNYYRKLLNFLKKSHDYSDFVNLMSNHRITMPN
tara:strand:- start:357 stop:782 length:426 start_codon:yes stop_codon:yes gene_type:complete